MNRLLDDLRDWAVIVLVLLCMLLAWAAGHYRDLAGTKARELSSLQGQVRHQNELAKIKLDEMTRQRDAKQAQLDDFQKTQEKKDEAAKLEIARLAGELEQRPIRVRVVAQTANGRPGGSGAPGEGTAPADAGTGDPTQAFGLLPDGNSRRLVAVIAEAENINAAYASCRARLLMQEGAAQ